jgi:hypothetical protein
MKKLIIIPLLALGLIACQANTTEDPVKKEMNETNETNENKEAKESDSLNNEFEKVDLELYNEVIDNYATFTKMSQEEAENASLEGVKSGAYDFFYSGNIFGGISVTYYDLNDDGIEELLIALRSDSDVYALIDLLTIEDGEVISLFTDEMSASAMYKRSGFSLLENGNLIYTTASGAGDKYGMIYELKEEEMEYVETYEVSTTEGDFEIIEKEFENTLDLKTLNWNAIEKEKENESTVYDDFMDGDFSAIEGIWKNGYDNEWSLVRIEGNEFSYQDGSRLIIDFTKENSDEESSVFNLMEEDGIGGASLLFYPENSEIEFGDEFVPSDSKKNRFFVTQTDAPEEKAIYYKVSDLND